MIPYLAAACVATGLFVAALIALWPRAQTEMDEATLHPYDPGIAGWDEHGPIPGPSRPSDSGNPVR
jgi:hypothetical protein